MPHKRQHAAFCGTLPAAAYTPLSCAAQGLGNLPAVLLFTLRRSVSKGHAGDSFLDIWSLFPKACPVYYALQPAYKQLFAGFRLFSSCYFAVKASASAAAIALPVESRQLLQKHLLKGRAAQRLHRTLGSSADTGQPFATKGRDNAQPVNRGMKQNMRLVPGGLHLPNNGGVFTVGTVTYNL